MAPSTLGWRPAAGRDSGRCSGLLFVAIKQEHTALCSGMNTMLVCKSPSLLVNIRIVLQHHLVDTVNACSDFKLPSREGKTAWFHLSYLIFRYFRTISCLSGTYRVINPFIMKYSTYLAVCFNGPVEEFCLSTY